MQLQLLDHLKDDPLMLDGDRIDYYDPDRHVIVHREYYANRWIDQRFTVLHRISLSQVLVQNDRGMVSVRDYNLFSDLEMLGYFQAIPQRPLPPALVN